MNNTFAPNKPEKMVTVEISARECHLLKVLRKYNFGKIMIYKANRVLIRVEPTESQLISEDEGLSLPLDK